MSIGSRIRDARKKCRLTQAELAKKCGITKSAISNYENGVSSPDIEKLSLIMECLGVDPNYIYQDYFIVQTSISPSFICTPDEQALVEAYRQATEDERGAIRLILNKYSVSESRQKKTG